MWLFELDVALIGDEEAPQRVAELIQSHNNEILRIRRCNMRNESGSQSAPPRRCPRVVPWICKGTVGRLAGCQCV